MGRTLAVVLHALVSIIAAGLYFLFVLPRWWELNGDISFTWGTVLRIVTGALIGLAAMPVVLTWLRTRRPEYGTPQLALRLRICSIALHLLSAVLIIGTAISELWFKLDDVGQWLFGIYGAAAAVALLGIFSFYLSFIAELPPPPPRPVKKKEKKERKSRWRRGKTGEAEEATADETAETEPATEETEDAQETPATVSLEKSATPGEDTTGTEETPTADDETPAAEDTLAAEAPRGGLRNRRPSGKVRRPRRGRKSDGGVAVDD
ncbi:MAG TPA: hypothetical protein VH496_02510 [Mycobacterium sp.]|jgi:hypothetical protein